MVSKFLFAFACLALAAAAPQAAPAGDGQITPAAFKSLMWSKATICAEQEGIDISKYHAQKIYIIY